MLSESAMGFQARRRAAATKALARAGSTGLSTRPSILSAVPTMTPSQMPRTARTDSGVTPLPANTGREISRHAI